MIPVSLLFWKFSFQVWQVDTNSDSFNRVASPNLDVQITKSKAVQKENGGNPKYHWNMTSIFCPVLGFFL